MQTIKQGSLIHTICLMAFFSAINADETFGARLLSIHNIRFLTKLTEDIKDAIINDRFNDFKEEFFKICSKRKYYQCYFKRICPYC